MHGRSGIGKSTFCSRAEDVIFLATEPGLNAIEAYKYEPEPGRYLIETWEELVGAYRELRADPSRRFKTACIDTGNNAFRLCQEYICKLNGVKHETDIPGNAKGYTLINNEFARLIKAFSGLQMGLYIACHTREVTVKTKTLEWTKQVPDFPDKARGMLVSLSDFVLFADVEEYEDEKEEGKRKSRRIIHSKPTALYEAKYRFAPLPDPIPLSYKEFIKEFVAANGPGNAKSRVGGRPEDKMQGSQAANNQTAKPNDVKPETKSETRAETKTESKPDSKQDKKQDTGQVKSGQGAATGAATK
jgi:hypothetical protein